MEKITIPKPNVHTESSLVRPAANQTQKKPEAEKKSLTNSSMVVREPTFKEKLKRSFVREDIKDIRDYVIFDIVLPALRRSLFDTIVGTFGQILGVSIPKASISTGYNGNKLSPHERKWRDYSSISSGSSTSGSIERYDRFYAMDFPFALQEDATATLEYLMDVCDTNGWVPVSRFFEFADPNSTIAGRNPYTNENYGWYDINGTTVREVEGYGYVLTLPAPRVKRKP